MSNNALLDLWDVLSASTDPPHCPAPHRSGSRILHEAPPLCEPREPAAFVRAMLCEYRKADHGEGRARHELKEAVRNGAPIDEQRRLADIHQALLVRMVRVEDAITRRVR